MWKDEEQDGTRGRNAGTAATISIRFPKENHKRRNVLLKMTPNPETTVMFRYINKLPFCKIQSTISQGKRIN